MTAIQSRVEATKLLDEKLGEHPMRTAALELGNKYLGTKVKLSDGKELSLTANSNFVQYPELRAAAKEYIAAYKEAPQLVRMYLDGYSATFFSFSGTNSGVVYRDIIKMSGKVGIAEKPFEGTAPAITVKKPKTSDYAGGANDPAYIEALNAYLAQKKENVEFTQAKCNYEYNMNIEAMKDIIASVPELKNATDVALKLYEGYLEFDQTGNTQKASDAMDVYNAMTDEYDLAVYKSIGGISVYYMIYLNSKKDDYAYSNLGVSQLYKKCEETAGMSLVAEFEEFISKIDLSTVDNGVVASAQEKYKQIPVTLLSKISDEITEKYNEILKLYDPVKPLTPSDYKFEKEISEYRQASLIAGIPGVHKAFGIIATVENVFMSIIYRLSVKTLITNKNVSIIGSLYDMIADANLVASGINVSSILAPDLAPSKMASFLEEEKFAGAKAKLLKAAEADDTTNAYANIKFESGDWGFNDGDADGFVNALAAALRPVTNILHNGIAIVNNVIYLPNSTASNGDYVYGAYEELIPILEGIGLRGVISSEEYTQKFYEAQKGNTYDYLDSLIIPVLKPITNLIEDIEKKPVFTIFDILPNVARTIDTGVLNKQVKAFLGKSSLLKGINVDLSADGINNMICNKTFSIPLNNRNLSITCKEIDWNVLSRCGSLTLTDSASASNSYSSITPW